MNRYTKVMTNSWLCWSFLKLPGLPFFFNNYLVFYFSIFRNCAYFYLFDVPLECSLKEKCSELLFIRLNIFGLKEK